MSEKCPNILGYVLEEVKHESAWDKQLTQWLHIERSHRNLEVKERTEALTNVTPVLPKSKLRAWDAENFATRVCLGRIIE